MTFFAVKARLRSWMFLAGFLVQQMLAQLAYAQPEVYELGVHYQELSVPLPDLDPERIDVVELFWYGCADCYDLLPTSQIWEASYRTTDMTFARMPVLWNDIMETHARIYLTAAEAGLLPVVNKSAWQVTPTIHNGAFDAIHKDNNPLHSAAGIAALFAEWGVSAEIFEQTWNSEVVSARLAEMKAVPGLAEIASLPALVVNGRYVITFNEAVPTSEELYKVLSALVVQIRGTKRVESH